MSFQIVLKTFLFWLKDTPRYQCPATVCVQEREGERGGGEKERERGSKLIQDERIVLCILRDHFSTYEYVYMYLMFFFLVRNLTEEIINHKEEIVKYMVLILP